jgi:hypothetical protein
VEVHNTLTIKGNKRHTNLHLLEQPTECKTKIFVNSTERDFDFNPFLGINKSQSNNELSRTNQLCDRKLENTFSSCQFVYLSKVKSKQQKQASKKELSFSDTDNKIEVVDRFTQALNETSNVANDIAQSEATTDLPQPIIATNSSSSDRRETTTNEVIQIR